jgi:hypothetical protein
LSWRWKANRKVFKGDRAISGALSLRSGVKWFNHAEEDQAMRTLMSISLPVETFDARMRDGIANQLMGRILEDLKPEAIYFTEQNGERWRCGSSRSVADIDARK